MEEAKKNKDVDKMPIEVKFLVSRYKLDMKKVNYNQLLQIIALVSSFDIFSVCCDGLYESNKTFS